MIEMNFEDIKEYVERLLSERNGRVLVIGIDGMCASGKTTLSERLAACFNAAVIHMDDFFLPKELRTQERLNAPGGNVHYERFKDEVFEKLLNIKNGAASSFSYRRFDCSAMKYDSIPVICPPSQLYIVEGAYSMRPELCALYDLKIFSEIDPGLQRKRILSRNGQAGLKSFTERWIPMENKYFDFYSIREGCDIIFNSEF